MSFHPEISLSGFHHRVNPFPEVRKIYLEEPKPRVIPHTLKEKIVHVAVVVFEKMQNAVYAVYQVITRCFTTICKEKAKASYTLAYSLKGMKEHLQGPPKKAYKIICFDGGGTRGVIPIAMLTRLEEVLGAKISDVFDCIAGTSTGGIIAAGLTIPSKKDPMQTRYTVKELGKLYNSFAKKIFFRSIFHKIGSLWGYKEAKYPSPGEIFRELVGDVQVQHCVANKLILTSFDVLSGNPVLFQSREDISSEALSSRNMHIIRGPGDTPICEAVEATTAAPTYFPTKPLRGLNLVDGGIALNNPAQIATLLSLDGEAKDRPIFIVSLGTGKSSTEPVTSKKALSWGALQWIEPIIHYLLESSSKLANEQLELLADSNKNIKYIRLQVILENEEDCALDNADEGHMEHLAALGTQCFEHYLKNGGYEALIEPLKREIVEMQR